MQGFEDVTLSWGGESYTVPADQQLMLVARIEAAIRAASGKQAVPFLLTPGGPDYAALSMAYGAALRYAGCDVTDADIYLAIQEDMAEQKADVAIKVQGAIMGLIAIVSPPLGSKLLGDEKGKKPRAAKVAKTG